MRAHYLQQFPFEGLGSIESWLKAAGYLITKTRLLDSASLPEVDDIDLLVVMGGPVSMNDESEFPWLSLEKRFIYNVIESGKSVLGICLGAQLIASAMGARLHGNPEEEMLAVPAEKYRAINDLMGDVLSFLQGAKR